MNRIEFIGGSYVGKSTLFNSLQKEGNLGEHIVTEKQILQIQRNQIGKIRFYFLKLLQVLLRMVGKQFDVYRKNEKLNQLHINFDDYREVISFVTSEEAIKQKGDEFSKLSLARLENKVINLNYYKSFFHSSDKTILIEESIIHWLIVDWEDRLSKELENTSIFNESIFLNDKSFFPKGIILCYADKEVIKQRIVKRRNENKINKGDVNLAEDEILNRTLGFQYNAKLYAERYESLGGKVLRLNTGDSLKLNVDKIKLFLNTF